MAAMTTPAISPVELALLEDLLDVLLASFTWNDTHF